MKQTVDSLTSLTVAGGSVITQNQIEVSNSFDLILKIITVLIGVAPALVQLLKSYNDNKQKQKNAK